MPHRSSQEGMSPEEIRRILVVEARRLGILLDVSMIEAFECFLDELTKWKQKINLTSLGTVESIVVKHFLDSLVPSRYLPRDASLLDIGSGAGFPGIPLKIARPDLRVVLLEAVKKKTYFHKRVIRLLSLSGIQSIWGRSDQEEPRTMLNNRFDVVISRAVSSLESFLQDSVCFLRPGGMIVAMRGKERHRPPFHDALGLRLDRSVSIDLPRKQGKRHILFYRRRPVSR